MYAVTLYQYYNATIVSSLLLEPPRNIRTLKDLLDSDLKAGSHDIVYDQDYFKVSRHTSEASLTGIIVSSILHSFIVIEENGGTSSTKPMTSRVQDLG